ncbi:MAG: YARHG domain-containing protein [Lachnospiraceae bacterium]|nr:YARHG domain-containing protein [Lachnospiraceae bacterium]
MRKKLLILFLGVCIIGISACGMHRQAGDAGSTEEESADVLTGADSGTEQVSQPETEPVSQSGTETASGQHMTDGEMLKRFHDTFYAGLSDEEIEQRVIERASACRESSYNEAVTGYWENVRGVTDISCRIDPLFFTDMKYYSENDFQDVPPEVIHLAKNEIYARHGYIFKSEDLNNYFMGCAWYQPRYSSDEFSDSVFNDYEQANLKLLGKLDK